MYMVSHCDNYFETYKNDLLQADKNIVLSSPVISGAKVYELISLLRDKQVAGLEITIVTWEPDSYGFETQLLDAIT